MSGELNFEIMPFEAYDGFRTPGGFEVEKEFGRRAGSRGVSARAPRVIPSRSTRASVSPFTGPKKPPVRTPRFRLPRWPRGAAFEPYGTAVARYPDEPPPAGSEYMRWVQSALNDVLGLQLPLNGIGDWRHATPSAAFSSVKGFPSMASSAPIPNER